MKKAGNHFTIGVMGKEVSKLKTQYEKETNLEKKRKIEKEIKEKEKVVLLFSTYQP